jgi:hypothetical protein
VVTGREGDGGGGSEKGKLFGKEIGEFPEHVWFKSLSVS